MSKHKEHVRIVVADDDDQMRALVVEVLTRAGYDVVEAASGDALLARLAADVDGESTQDLIVTDNRMPGFNGLDLLQALRTLDLQTPVVLMTAFPDDSTRSAARRLHATLLDKPFMLDELLAVVEVIVEDLGSVRAPTSAARASRTIH